MVTLRPEQANAVEHLKTGSILVGGVGSGKSITALAYFIEKVCRGNYSIISAVLQPKDLYIITTARKRDTLEWEDECRKFGLSSNKTMSVSHISVKVDSWNNVHKYYKVSNAFFIFDEQRVVGSGAWVKAFLEIAKHNEWILLSATPGDTWSDYIPVFIANGYFKNRTQFLRRHAVFDRFAKYPKIIRYIDIDILKKYRDNILVKMSDKRKTIRHIEDVTVEYQKDIYDLAFKQRWNPYTEEPILDAGQLCHILRRIVNTDYDRVEKLLEIIDIHQKAIVFYNLNAELDKLKEAAKRYLEPDGFAVAEWNGHRHEAIPKTDKWIYLVQYTAGAEGWNCVETDTVIFYSLHYSYKIMEQATGRIDRINTSFKDLYYYRFVSDSSIDKSILRALRNKRNFNENNFVRT